MTAKQTSKITPKTRGGKKLMSELLTDTRNYIEQAEQADVESLRQFLLTNPERPLIAMGHGGAHSSASYAALLYGTNCSLGRVVTPYQANSFSDETLRNSKLLLVSTSLKNQDAVYIADRMIRVNPQHSCALTMTVSSVILSSTPTDSLASMEPSRTSLYYIKPLLVMPTSRISWLSRQSLPTITHIAASMVSRLRQTLAPSRNSPYCTDHTVNL